MKASFKLDKQEFSGFQTISEVIEHICKNKNLLLDSFYLLDENDELLTAANSQINLANIQEIHVYNLRDNYLLAKKLTQELQGEIGQNEQINIEKGRANQYLYEKLQKFNLENEIIKLKYEKCLRQFNTSNQIVNMQLKSFNTQNDNAKMQLEFQLHQFIDDNQCAKIKLEQQIESYNTNSSEAVKIGFEQLLQQFNEDNEIAIMELKRLLQQLSVDKETANKNLQKKLLQQLEQSNSQESHQKENSITESEEKKQKFQLKKYESQEMKSEGFDQLVNAQISQITEEKKGLETQIQSNEKQYKQTIIELEEKHSTEKEDIRKQLDSSKTVFEEQEQMIQKLIKEKNKLKSQIQQSQDEVLDANKKYKTLEFDYGLQQKKTGKVELEVEQERVKLREQIKRNDCLLVEFEKINQLSKTMSQREPEYRKRKLEMEEEIKKLQKQLGSIAMSNQKISSLIQESSLLSKIHL